MLTSQPRSLHSKKQSCAENATSRSVYTPQAILIFIFRNLDPVKLTHLLFFIRLFIILFFFFMLVALKIAKCCLYINTANIR